MKEIKIEIPLGYEIDQEASTFERIVFKEVIKDITEKVKSFDDVISYLGENDEDVVEYRKLIEANITSKALSFQMLICWVKALNEKTTLDWSNSNKYKYYLWWYMNAFLLDHVSYCYEGSSLPSALCFKKRNLAEYASTNQEFIATYKKYML